jgi:hypothetical protein
MTNARDKANIPVLNFQSKGIDDNATSTAITIDSGQNVGINGSPNSYSGYGNLTLGGTSGGIFDLDVNGTRTGSFLALSSEVRVSTITNVPLHFQINNAEKMRLTSNGLGIGTSNPGAKLDVVDSSNSVQMVIRGRSSDNFGILQFKNNAGSASKGEIKSDTSSNLIFRAGASTDDLTILSGGNIGIGNTNPSSKLEVTGAILASVSGTGLQSRGTNAQIHADASSGYGALIADGASGQSSHIFFQTAGSDKARLTADSSGNFLFGAGGATERMRITDAGRVGIGESSPDNTLHVNSTSSTVTKFERDSGSNGSLTIGFPSTRTNLEASGDMRLTATRVLINKSSPGSLTNAEVIVDHDGSSTYGIRLNSSSTSGTQYHQSFDRGESQAGYITSNSATTIAFNNASDERLKENIQNSGSAIQDIKDIKVRQFDWKDGIDTHRDFGFVAQELVNVVPEAVSQGTDELNDNGKPIRSWGVDYSHIVPRLVKVCQEQQTKIESLEAEVTALKNQP